jgi:epoxide hydrolase
MRCPSWAPHLALRAGRGGSRAADCDNPEPEPDGHLARREAMYQARDYVRCVVIKPFQIEVSDSDLVDLRQRLSRLRLGRPPVGDAWESGVDYDYLADLIAYWRDVFDWRARERYLNGFPQFKATLNGQTVHFVRIEADRERYRTATPMIVSHGWPYSYVEFLEFAGWLADPLSHGGGEEDAFDVVIPSLPGYGFSPPLSDAWFNGEVVARLWHQLMTSELGYTRYATYGEDVGTTVSDWLGALFPESVLGLFATHAAFPPEERADDLDEAEERFRAWLQDKWKDAGAYSQIQATRPDTLAVSLNDSPAGLLAWLVEKFREWSGPDFENSWSRDDVLTTASLYWFTGTIGTSFLPYYHGRKHEPALPLVDVPVGVAVQWGERGFPREYAERTYTDIRLWTDLPSGGHFTAKQSPDLVADAMRRFFASL